MRVAPVRGVVALVLVAALARRAIAEDAPTPTPSLASKLEPLLAASESATDANAIQRANSYLESTLRSIGAEALPAIERILLGASPVRAANLAQVARVALGVAVLPAFENV